MRVNIQFKLIAMITLVVLGIMLLSLYFISRAVEARMVKMFRAHLDNTLASVEQEYRRISDETLASAESFAGMIAVVRNVLLGERLEIQREVAKLKAGVELDVLEVGDAQGLVLVGGLDLEAYGEDKSGDPLIQAALAGRNIIDIEPAPQGLLIKAVTPIKLQEKTLGTFTTGFFLDQAFLDRIKRMTNVELFLFRKEKGQEQIVVGTLSIDRARAQNIFADVLKQEHSSINIGGKPFMLGIVPLANMEGERIGTIVAGRSREELIATIDEMRNFFISIGLVGVVIATIVGYILAKRFTTPLQLLVQGTQRLSKGDLAYRVEIKNTDEFGDLATSFNKMALDLASAIEKEKHLAAEAAAAAVERKRAAELQKAYKELQQAQDMLVQAEKLKAIGLLASSVAHEVRNPLGIILQGISYLEKKFSPEQKDFIETFDMVKDSVRRADKIITSLVDFSRASRFALAPEDINSVVESSWGLVKARYKLKKVEVVMETKKGIPKVLIDRNRIEQVLVNLLINALQAMPPEGGKITIRTFDKQLEPGQEGIGARKEDHFKVGETAVIVEVEDTGMGISKEVIGKVFDPFFSTKGPREGTGLGLAVTRNIIDIHKGLITIKSEEGKGTKIILTLKIA